ncbi:hypothetical protein [Bradyrhizobium sp.]|jgi:hypothetical protein|uniref:hypothetical protein n=1 Tax=Bradyrhizobium sp. TaxID=376 RepID=UPI003D0D88B6
MTHPDQRRRQILDDETGEAQRFDASRSGATSPRNQRVRDDTRLQEDKWVTSLAGRLEALIRNIRGSRKK